MSYSLPPSLVIARLLIEMDLVCDPSDKGVMNWPVFVTGLQHDPDEQVAIYDTEGIGDGRLQHVIGNDGCPISPTIDHPGLQIRTRSESYGAAYKKLSEISLAFDNNVRWRRFVVEDINFLIQGVHRLGTLFSLGRDENRRFSVVGNFILTLEESCDAPPNLKTVF